MDSPIPPLAHQTFLGGAGSVKNDHVKHSECFLPATAAIPASIAALFLNSRKHLRYWEYPPPVPGNLSVSRDVTSVRGIAYTQCIRTMHNVKPGEGSELKRVNARNREDPYRVQRLGVILVGGGPYPFQPCHNAMLGFRHFSSWKSHEISATVAEPCFGTSLWKWTFFSLCSNYVTS
jgi:hypothetical protein